MKLVQNMQICKFQNNRFINVCDEVIVEFPFEIYVNDEKLITLMCTPNNLDYLAIGYLFSDGIINNYNDIEEIIINKDNNAFVYTKNKIDLTCKHSNRARTSGCGNATMPDNYMDYIEEQVIVKNNITTKKIEEITNSLYENSGLFLRTGGVHNTSLWNDKEMMMFHEDIGRHNTLDKIIGESLVKNIELNDKIIYTSGRISSEMLVKTAKAHIGTVISRSTVTNVAKEIADELGITLIGFSRKNRFNIYSDKHKRILI